MAIDSSIKIPGSPDLLETVKTADHKHREGMFLGDPQSDAARAKVTNAAPAADSYGLTVRLPDSPMFDAFNRLRTSHPSGLFQTQCQYDAEPLILETGTTGTGVAPAHSANTRMVALSATAGNGTSFIQSYEYIPYQAGKSQLIFVTGVFGAAVAGATVDQGAFDAANGIFLRQNGASGMQFVLRSSTSGGALHNTADQVDWSEDTLDGNGSSGITLDVTKTQILVIDAQFLAMGRVRCGFDINGTIIWAHHFNNANVIAVPYMQTLTLPIQMLVTAASTGSTKTAHFKCASVSSEGGFHDEAGFFFSTLEQTVTAASGARTQLLSLRPLTTFNGLPNRQRVRIEQINLLVTSNTPVLWELCIGTTFSAAPTWGAVNTAHSGCEATTGVGTVATAGIVIESGYIASTATSRQSINAKIAARYPITLNRAGAVRDNGTMSLLVTGLGAGSATRATFEFSEMR